MTMRDETVWDSETFCDLLLDPPHLWSLLELVDFYHSRRVVINFHHKPGALVKKTHQSIIYYMAKLVIFLDGPAVHVLGVPHLPMGLDFMQPACIT